jgi:hypothetical protein
LGQEQLITELRAVAIRVTTGSGAVTVIGFLNQENKTPEALKSVLAIRGGELGKSGPGVGWRFICKGVIEHRGRNGGRLYVRRVGDIIEIVGKSGKDKKNQAFVINRLRELYG